MFCCSTRCLRLCLLAALLSIMGLDDTKKVHGASQFIKKPSGSHASLNGLATKSSTSKKLPGSLTQGLELVTGGQTTESTSSVKRPVSVKVFTERTKNESEENSNAKKKKRKKKLSRLPVEKPQVMIKGGINDAFQDRKKSQKTMLSFSKQQHSQPRRLTKIDLNPIITDLKSLSIRKHAPTQRSIEVIEPLRSKKQVSISKPNNNPTHSKSLHGKAMNELLDKSNWIQTKRSNAKEDTNMEDDSSLSVNSGNDGDFYKSSFVENHGLNNNNGQWRILESKKVLLSYPNDSQEEIISSIIGNPLTSNIASFEQKVKLKKNKDGATDAIETAILNSTTIEQRPAPRQIDIDNLTDHIRQHIFRDIGYPIYQWPWHMSVQEANSNGWQHLCYGAVVSQHSVLTNAECVYRKPLPSLRIVRHNIIDKVITLNNSSYIVARVIHPEYKRYLERLHKFAPIHPQHVRPVNVNDHHIRRNNLALLQMRHQFGVDPIHLDDEAHAHRYETCYTLDHRPVRLISNQECNYYFGAEHIGRSHLCAYGLPCYIQHHHGSPLVCSHHGQRPYLVGLSSYQQSCGHHHPTVYERIAPYTNWITSNLK